MPTTVQDVLDMCAAIKRFIENLREMRVTSLAQPGSPAYAEWASFPKPIHLRAASDQATLCLESAVEHLEATVEALERTFVMAAWTCLRVEIEACAVSAWLTTLQIDATTRVGRGFAVRHQSIDQMLAFVRATGPRIRSRDDRILRQKQIEHLSGRRDRLESEAASVGLMPVVNRVEKRIGSGVPWPGSTELIEQVFGLETALLYRAGSVVVHSNPSALLDFTLFDKASPISPQDKLRKALDAGIAARMCQTGIEVYAKAFWSCARYLGERIDDLADLLDSLAADLSMPVERQFWKQPTAATDHDSV